MIDSNICIYRTLANLEDKNFYRGELKDAFDKIQLITNNCKSEIIVSNLILNELKDKSILFKEVVIFCNNVLHKPYMIQTVSRQAEKSLDKFLSKYLINNGNLVNIKNHNKHINNINNFYLKYPEKLKGLTDKKIKNMNSFDKGKKLQKRPSNLPEESDRLLLSQAIELKNFLKKDIYIFSNDGDFTEFKNEILKEFEVPIISIGDNINLDE